MGRRTVTIRRNVQIRRASAPKPTLVRKKTDSGFYKLLQRTCSGFSIQPDKKSETVTHSAKEPYFGPGWNRSLSLNPEFHYGGWICENSPIEEGDFDFQSPPDSPTSQTVCPTAPFNTRHGTLETEYSSNSKHTVPTWSRMDTAVSVPVEGPVKAWDRKWLS